MSEPKADDVAEGASSHPDENAAVDSMARTIVGPGSVAASAAPEVSSSLAEDASSDGLNSIAERSVSDSGSLDGNSEARGVRPRSYLPDKLSSRFSGLYEIKSQLGSGGMGAVYRARDTALHRTVAIKVMHDHVAAKEHMVRRFYKEAQITAQLEHPGIVPTYGIDMSGDGQPRLAMRLIRGKNLEQLLEETADEGTDPIAAQRHLFDRLELFARTCDAVHFAHEKGVVHRDLKPENIMIGPHRDAYVMDWGLATVQSADSAKDRATSDELAELAGEIDVDADLKATRFGEMMGTIAYMPPEQALGETDKIGPASDQFAMGMTLQEVITLTSARTAPNINAGITLALLNQKSPVPNWVPLGLTKIIEKATATDREHRYPSMKEFAEDIRRFLRDEELSVLPDSTTRKIWRKLSRHQTLVLAALLGLVTVSAGLLTTHLRQAADHERAQAAHLAHVTELQGIVAARAQAITARTRGVEIELARLAGAIQQALLRPETGDMKVVTPEEMRNGTGPSDTKYVERYGQKISYLRAVFARAPDAIGEVADRDERRLSTLELDFKSAFDAGGYVRGTLKEQSTAPLQWIYAATPSGVLINYPAGSGLMPDYDPRTRPWYANNIGTRGPQWGGLYGDASGSGTLLPCNRAVYDNSGKLLAIVGIDFRLTDVEAEVPLRELPGFKSAWLLNREGSIIAEARAEALSGPDVQDLGTRALESFKEPKVLATIKKQKASGQVEVGRVRYLYAQIPSLDWTYLVATDIKK